MIGRSAEQSTRRLALVNGHIVFPHEIAAGKAVVVEGGKIAGICDMGALGSEVEKIDLGGRIVTPGLIDIHTHGALGHTFNEPTEEAFATIGAENARHGVTALLATLAPAPIPDLVRCLEFCRSWTRAPRAGSHMLGVHLESPYLSPAQKGALDPQTLRTPDDGTPDILLQQHDVIKIMTLAPELPGALELIARLTRLGIVPSAGHSAANDGDLRAAMRVGLRHVTHIWNAMSGTIKEGPWRKPGLLEAALAFDGLTVEMIADNRHLPATLMKLAYKCLGAKSLCVISDATGGAGLAEGARFRMGEMQYEVREGVGMLLDQASFAGSATLLNQMIPVLVDVVGIPLVDVVRMLTLTPAHVIGVQDRKGSIEPGKDADLAIFDDDFTAWRTMIEGRWVQVK